MFDIEKEYKKEYQSEYEYIDATKSASINQHNNRSGPYLFKSLFLIGIVGVVGYFGFNYINSGDTPKKSKVMGVSHINPDESSVQTPSVKRDSAYIRDNIKNIVSSYETTMEARYKKPKDISNELNSMVEAFYNQKASIPIELSGIVDKFYEEEKRGAKSRVITVKEGDTLALIAQRFYGDAMEYQKIIDANRQLQKSTTLYIGEKIKVPY